MESNDAIRLMCKKSGKSLRAVSRELGKSHTFLSSTMTKGSVPQVDTMASIAHACGFRLVLQDEDTSIELDAG